MISIHAAREGGDVVLLLGVSDLTLFQSTPPVKAATASIFKYDFESLFQSTPPVKAATPQYRHGAGVAAISIHAAREGGDHTAGSVHARSTAFQSTPPVKAATSFRSAPAPSRCTFQSTPPVKAATIFLGKQYLGQKFQSTPPVKAATCKLMPLIEPPIFQSTPPVKAATMQTP